MDKEGKETEGESSNPKLAELLAKFAEEIKKNEGKKQVEFPLTINGIALDGELGFGGRGLFRSCEPGAWVSIRPCSEDAKNKTYLGVYLGDLPSNLAMGLTEDGKLAIKPCMHNPAIWVPDLKRVVMGYESWWDEIKSPEGLRQITDCDVNNVWYVQALKAISKKDQDEKQ